jgi:hypothetical protein
MAVSGKRGLIVCGMCGFLGSGLAAGCGWFEEALGRLPGDQSRACPQGWHVCPKALDGSVFPGGWQHQRTNKLHPCQNPVRESLCALMMPSNPRWDRRHRMFR